MLPAVCSLGSDAGGLASAATSGPEKMVIRIGALLDQTGGSTSPLYRAAVELAVGQMNQALTRTGSRLAFEMVFGDRLTNHRSDADCLSWTSKSEGSSHGDRRS